MHAGTRHQFFGLGGATGRRRATARGKAGQPAPDRHLRCRLVDHSLRFPHLLVARRTAPEPLLDSSQLRTSLAHLGGEFTACLSQSFALLLPDTAALCLKLGQQQRLLAHVALGTGAVAFQQATPGAIALGPLIAGVLAQQAAIASFPLGAGAGAIWYGFFPATTSPVLVAGATAGLLGVAAVAASFAGVLADPALRRTGVHERRLLKMIDGLEAGFGDRDAAGFQTYDLYLARLMDLSDALVGVLRALR